MRRALGLAVSFVVLATASCSSDSSAPSAPGPVNGADGGLVADGTAPPGDGSLPPQDSGAAVDAAKDGNAPPPQDGSTALTCASAGLLFCDDFESYPLGTAKGGKWTPVTNNGTLTIDTAHVRGAKALHVSTQLNGFAYARLGAFAPPNNSFFGRMYAWVTAYPSAPDYAHFTLVEAAAGSGTLVRPIGGQYVPNQGPLLGTGSDGGPTGDWENWKASAPAQAGAWKCFEWELRANDNVVNVWVDSIAKTDLTVSTKSHGGTQVDFVFPTFDHVWFGWWLYQGGSTPTQFDIWLDDIVLSTTRIGC